MSANKRHTRTRGFTLIEILVAITLLTIVLAIIYGSYSAVVMGIERTQAENERLKTSMYIARAFTENLAQATEGWSPGSAYRTASTGVGSSTDGQTPQPAAGNATAASSDRGEMRFPFTGEAGRGRSLDQLTFVSTAPMTGGGTLPGQVKLCTYRVENDHEGDDGAMQPPPDVEQKPKPMILVMTETPWTSAEAGAEPQYTNTKQLTDKAAKAAEETGQKEVSRSVSVYGWDLAYFNGKEWVEKWDAQQTGYLPWSVRVRVKLDPPKEGEAFDPSELDPEKDASVLELLFNIPVGAGIHDAPPAYVRPSERSGAGNITQ
jgi:prepilin-type N-terminal cleavage/methylation domain-containing protein